MNPVIDLRQPGPRQHHPTLSPSSIAAILQCACYTGRGESDDDANKGEQLHNYTQDLVAGKQPSEKLERGEKEACEWAAEETLALFNQHIPGENIRIEEHLKIHDGAGRIISSGYADFNGGCLVVDLKSGLDYRPDLHYHKPQLHAYALAVMQRDNIDRVLCVEIYILAKRKREYWVTRTECEATIAAAIARRRNPDKYPLVNDYCKWCDRLIWCPAINGLAWRTVELFAKANGQEALFAAPERIDCPETMAQALTIAKKTLTPLIKRIEDAALKLSETKELPYYIRTSSNPREKIVDVRAAFNRLPFDNKEFCMALSTTPKAVTSVYADKFDVPESQARQTVNGLLEDLIVRGESNPTLKPLLQNQTKKRGRNAA
jgi:CRISPR/Cas system-associated exonuclease Cas4 (RecB family)